MVEKRKSSVRKWLVATGMLTGVKAKIIAATAAAAIGTVGVVAYKEITQPAKEPAPPVVREVEQTEPPRPTQSSKEPGSAEIVQIKREPRKVVVDTPDTEDDENITRSRGAKAGSDGDIAAGSGTVRRTGGYGSRGSFGARAATPPEENKELNSKDSNSTEDSNLPPRRVRRQPRRHGG